MREEGAFTPPTPTVFLAVLAGQSNMEGRASPDRVNTDFATLTDVWQFDGYSGDTGIYQTIDSTIGPLMHYDGFRDVTPYDRLGPGEYICRQLLSDNPGSHVLLVPTARGTTAMASGTTPAWAPSPTPGSGGYLFENMISQANLAYTKAQSQWPGSPIVVQIYWSQGEQDANNSCTESTYQTTLAQFISNARARITGATNAPFIIGSMIPQLWKIGDPHYSAAYAAINDAHVMTSLNVSGVYYSMGPYPGSSADGLHYSPAPFVRTYGTGMAATLSDNVGPTMTSASSYSNTLNQPLSFALSGSDVHQTFHINGGSGASNFQISDPYLTPTLQWTGNGTGPVNGTYQVGVRARDGAGNYGPTQMITVTVASEVSPATFFTGGEAGMVWDLSNFANMSQTIDASTPVTAVGQTVGWVKDLSPNANHWVAQNNDTTRPTLQQDANGKYYLQFSGTQVLLAAAPFVVPANTPKVSAGLAIYGAAQTATKTLLSTGSASSGTPYVVPFQAATTTTNITIADRSDGGGQLSPQPMLLALDSTVRVLSSQSSGGNANANLRDATTRATDGSGGWTTTAVGSGMAPPFSVTRSALGANCGPTPANFFNGRIYSGYVINRILSTAETMNGENWTANRALTTKLPGQA